MDRLKKRKSVDSRDEIWCVCVISHGIAVDRKNTAEGHFKDLCTALDAGHWCELNNGLLGDFVHFVFEFQFQ